MKVYVDEYELPREFDSLHEAINEAGDITNKDNRIIIEVYLDGQKLSSEVLAEAIKDNVTGTVLKCISGDLIEQVMEAFAVANNTLDQIISVQHQTADYVQEGNTAEVTKGLSDIIELWNKVQSCVNQGTTLVGMDLNAEMAGDTEIAGAINDLADQLKALRTAVTSGDWVTLSDTLAYEMGRVAELWQTLLNNLSNKISSDYNR